MAPLSSPRSRSSRKGLRAPPRALGRPRRRRGPVWPVHTSTCGCTARRPRRVRRGEATWRTPGPCRQPLEGMPGPVRVLRNTTEPWSRALPFLEGVQLCGIAVEGTRRRHPGRDLPIVVCTDKVPREALVHACVLFTASSAVAGTVTSGSEPPPPTPFLLCGRGHAVETRAL